MKIYSLPFLPSHVDARCCSVLLSLPLPARLSVRLFLTFPSPSKLAFLSFLCSGHLDYSYSYYALWSVVEGLLKASVCPSRAKESFHYLKVNIPFSEGRWRQQQWNSGIYFSLFSCVQAVSWPLNGGLRNPSEGRWGQQERNSGISVSSLFLGAGILRSLSSELRNLFLSDSSARGFLFQQGCIF